METKLIAKNPTAFHNYSIDDKLEVGIVLSGTEIKSIRNGNANIKDCYGIVKNGEVFLLNMHISAYEEGNRFNHNETRTRKLLLHKKEILKLNNKLTLEGYTLVPVKLYFVKNKAKILLGLCKGKKSFDKRETIKERDLNIEAKKLHKYNYK